MAVTRSQAAKRKHSGDGTMSTPASDTTRKRRHALQETTFPFLMLPAEIRNVIYLLALVNDGDIYVCSVDSFRAQVSQPALTRVSRQIRKECLPVFYGCNRFRILTFSGEQWVWPHVWLKDIGSANCLMLRRLRVGAFRLLDNEALPSPDSVTSELMAIGISFYKPLPSMINVYNGSSKQPPLTRVCKQIRAECLPLFYGANEFYAEVFAPRFKLPFWFEVIGRANCLLLRSLLVESFTYKPWYEETRRRMNMNGARFYRPLVSVENKGSGKACIWSYEFEKGEAPFPSLELPAKLTP